MREPENKFRYYGNKTIENTPLKTALFFFAPKILDALNIPASNPEATGFFKNLFQDMVDNRKREKECRKDFLNILIQLMNEDQVSDNNKGIFKNKDIPEGRMNVENFLG